MLNLLNSQRMFRSIGSFHYFCNIESLFFCFSSSTEQNEGMGKEKQKGRKSERKDAGREE